MASMRAFSFEPDVLHNADSSCRVRFGHTEILCTATVSDKLPPFLRGRGQGWITAEYGMLPCSTATRIERRKAASSGRTLEIQRLIGRALRAIARLEDFAEKQIIIDCDVIQADGGTRAASICGGYIALYGALARMGLSTVPLIEPVAAISCGIVDNDILLDLNYEQDSRAQADANFVMTPSGRLIEIQASAEKKPFTSDQLNAMIGLAKEALAEIFAAQQRAIQTCFYPQKNKPQKNSNEK